MMNFKPILFSTPMVQAIIAGSKTQTRRTKGLEKVTDCYFQSLVLHATGRYTFIPNGNYSPTNDDVIEVKCPYEVGDVLWVRETFFCTKDYEHTPLFQDKGKYVYRATYNFIGCHKWKPSIFMPKKACRLFFQVKSVRVERLQDITEEDAIAEGIEIIHYAEPTVPIFKKYDLKEKKGTTNPILSYQTLWHKINGPTSWVKNPWVWVIEFEKIEKPENFI